MQEVQNEIICELDRGIAHLASNLLAVAGGGGHPDNIIENIQSLASALSDYKNVEGCDPPLEKITGQLRSLNPDR